MKGGGSVSAVTDAQKRRTDCLRHCESERMSLEDSKNDVWAPVAKVESPLGKKK